MSRLTSKLRWRTSAFVHRVGTPAAAATLVIVLTLMGGAYAATKGKRGPRGPAGPPGPAGAAGPQGAAGVNGSNGTNGAPGTNGKTVLSGTGAPEGLVAGTAGDFYLRTNAARDLYGPKTGSGTTGWGIGTSLVGPPGAPGADGSPWTAGGTLPASTEPGCPCTETGTWSFAATQASSPDAFGAGEANQFAPISFPIPLAAALDPAHAVFVPKDDTTTAHCSAAPLNGTATNPKAESGYLCVYEADFSNAEPSPLVSGVFGSPLFRLGVGDGGAERAGTTLIMNVPAAGAAYAAGSWAVTG